jgi:hypothetical protein
VVASQPTCCSEIAGLCLAALDQDVLDDLDRRAQADAAGGLGQGAEQVQQDVEMGGQEGVEIDKGLAVEIDAIDARIDQLGVLPQLLAVLVEQAAERLLRGGRLAEQAPCSRSP